MKGTHRTYPQRFLLAFLVITTVLLSGCFGTTSRWTGVSGNVMIDSGAPQSVSSSSDVSLMSLPPNSGTYQPIVIFEENPNERTRGQYLLHVRAGTSKHQVRQIVQRYGFKYVRPSGDSFHLVERSGITLAEAEALFEKVPEVISVEWNAPIVPLGWLEKLEPNDPYYVAGHQWALDQMRVPQAWAALQTTGIQLLNNEIGDEIIVAIIDSGIDFDHEDLADENLWVDGWDFMAGGEGESYTFETGRGKEGEHGTLVAGIIGASTNNGMGIAGVAHGVVRMMPLRVFAQKPGTSQLISAGIAGIADAIEWAVDKGAHVINLSLGISCTSSSCSKPGGRLKQALDYAWDNGVIVVAASGNYGGGVISPANDDTVIAVGATANDGSVAGYSSYGSDLNVVAPGGGAYSCTSSNPGIIGPKVGHSKEYHCLPGTSFAAPHVSGVVALMLAAGRVSHPEEVLRTLEITAQRSSFNLDPFTFDDKYGWGIVDAYGAVTGAVPYVFVASVRDNHLNAEAAPVKAMGPGGGYQLSGVPPGTRTIYAWVDVDQSGTVNEGDYFGTIGPISIQGGRATSELNIVLTRYEGDTLTVSF